MKREVERERDLPAFSLTVGELELLWTRLSALFDNPEKVDGSINIRLPAEQLNFSSIEELKHYDQLPTRMTNFTINLSQYPRQLSIRSGRHLAIRAQVSARSEGEAWCAGAIDTVYSFVRSHKLWYSWFVTAPIGWLLIVLSNVPALFLFLPSKSLPPSIVFSWLFGLIAIFLLYFGREKVLPAAVIQVSPRNGFFRNHIPELSLAIAFFSVILTVVGWFVAK